MNNKIEIIRPSDMHVHFRQGDMLKTVLPYTARHMAYAVAMPNTKPPICTGADVKRYAQEIRDACEEQKLEHFQPILPIYFREDTTRDTIVDAAKAGAKAIKVYPRGGTTNSEDGIPLAYLNTSQGHEVLKAVQGEGLILCVHAEDPDETSRLREAASIKHLRQVLKQHPELRMVIEHVSTKELFGYVLTDTPVDTVRMTVTPHHVLNNIDDFMGGLLHPDLHVKPCLKEPSDVEVLRKAVKNGSHRIFHGSDSAPHDHTRKYCAEGCAGIFNAPTTIEAMASLFNLDDEAELKRFEEVMSLNGPRFYGLPIPTQKLTLIHHDPPRPIQRGLPKHLTTFMADRPFAWHALDE